MTFTYGNLFPSHSCIVLPESSPNWNSNPCPQHERQTIYQLSYPSPTLYYSYFLFYIVIWQHFTLLSGNNLHCCPAIFYIVVWQHFTLLSVNMLHCCLAIFYIVIWQHFTLLSGNILHCYLATFYIVVSHLPTCFCSWTLRMIYDLIFVYMTHIYV